MSVKNRVKEFIRAEGMKIIDFEKSLGVGNGYVNSIKKGIGSDKIDLIIELYSNLNIDWLITGRGEMYKEVKEKAPEVCNNANESVNYYAQKDADYWKDQYIALQKKYTALLENKLEEVLRER